MKPEKSLPAHSAGPYSEADIARLFGRDFESENHRRRIQHLQHASPEEFGETTVDVLLVGDSIIAVTGIVNKKTGTKLC